MAALQRLAVPLASLQDRKREVLAISGLNRQVLRLESAQLAVHVAGYRQPGLWLKWGLALGAGLLVGGKTKGIRHWVGRLGLLLPVGQKIWRVCRQMKAMG